METSELIAATADLRELVGLKEEPLAFFYSDREPEGYRPTEGIWECLVANLPRALQGETVYVDKGHYGCGGCGYYLGFIPPSPQVDYFVSTGIPGQMEGERYKKSPELVRMYRESNAIQPAPAPYAVFKPVLKLAAEEHPEVVICFGSADELAGLVGLANYHRVEDAVICPFGSGCGSAVARPLVEARTEQPRAVLGMFDPSARPFLPPDHLSFAAPVALWTEMLENARESFLQRGAWAKVRKRLVG